MSSRPSATQSLAGRRDAIPRPAMLYVAAMALVTAAYAVLSARAAQSWIMGEWLINYQGGFVRRGLLGESIFEVARALHRSPFPVALALQLLLYGAFYAAVLLLTRNVEWRLPLVALFLSPATLSFIVLDPPSSVRKEVLLLLAVALLCLVFARGGRLRPVPLAALLAPASGVCVLSHEGLVFFLPYLFAPVYLRCARQEKPVVPGSSRPGAHWLRQATLICLPAALVALGAAAASASHPGNPATSAAICHSLGGTIEGEGHGFCGGAITYLTHDPGYARRDLLRAAHAYHYGLLYTVTGLLAVLPAAFALAGLGRERRRDLHVLLATAALAGLGSAVLFSLARDWGRWLSIHVTCLLLLLLLVSRQEEQTAATRSVTASEGFAWIPFATRSRASGTALLLGLLLYGTCWNLPATGNYHARWGYFGLVRYLRNYRSSAHPASSPSQNARTDEIGTDPRV